MIKKLSAALAAVVAASAMMMAAAPANAAMVCHRGWVHGHPQRICRPVPNHRPPPRDFHGPGPHP